MSCVPDLIIDSIVIPLQAFPLAQAYSVLGGETLRRKLDGTAAKQSHWRKLSVTITGEGWMPPALAGVDWTASVEISCITPRAMNSATNSVVLPTARRTDVDCVAYAIIDGEAVSTPCTISTHTATATTVASADAYQFYYYPKLNFYSAGPTESVDRSTGTYTWTLEAEEA